jgi:hypothetical protein
LAVIGHLRVWWRATGYELLSERPGAGEARLLIRKDEPVRNDQTMTVIMSTASLEHTVYPPDKALAGAVLGMNVNIAFEGAGIRLLKRATARGCRGWPAVSSPRSSSGY